MADLKVGSFRKVGPAPEKVVQVINLHCFTLKIHKNILSNFGTSQQLVCTRQIFCLLYRKTVIMSVMKIHTMIVFLTACRFRAEQIFVRHENSRFFKLSTVIRSKKSIV